MTEARKQLPVSRSEFELLANAIPQMCFIAEAAGAITWYNHRWYEYTGATSEQMLGWGWQSVHDPTMLPQVLNQWNASLQTEMPFEMVFPLRSAKGVLRPFLTRVLPVRNEQGVVLRWVGTCTDISDLKQVETELRKTNAQLDLAIEVASLGEWELDAQRLIVTCSRRHAEIFGYRTQQREWEYTLFLNHVLPEFREEIDCKVRAALLNGTLDFETQIERVDGAQRWIWVRGRVLPPNLNQPHRIFGTVMDITERKEVEARLRWSEDQLRALTARIQKATEEERLRIARELHDQLGQALTGMKMDLAWIIRKFGPASRGTGESWVDLVQNTVKVVDSTIGLVRRLATELRPAMLDAFGLPAAIEWHAEEFEKRTGILCDVRVAHVTAEISEEKQIAMFRIFQEALTNVSRHAQASLVSIRLGPEGNSALFTLQDDGEGFSLRQLENSRSLGVLGMRERAHLIGADLALESEPGKGTMLKLRVPLGT